MADNPRHSGPLTNAERAVRDLAKGGLSNAEIATLLGRSVSTIENHVKRIYKKLGTDGRSRFAGSADASAKNRGRQLEGEAARIARRDVLQALRDPTPAMVSAAVQKAAEIGPHDHVGIWRAMIDAALGELK